VASIKAKKHGVWFGGTKKGVVNNQRHGWGTVATRVCKKRPEISGGGIAQRQKIGTLGVRERSGHRNRT